MSILMEVNKISGSPTLIMKDGYKSLDYSEKLQCLVSIKTVIEKEIAFTERELGDFVEKRQFV
jgi:hypothetical protein|tara:strand:- start:322 stop:510 length:189 start_codon:yes stop_codon:yes gene_type:complete